MRQFSKILSCVAMAAVFFGVVAESHAQWRGQRTRKATTPLPVLETESFDGKVLVSGLENPWALLWGPDGFLWLTERTGKTIKRIDPKTGRASVVGTINEVLVDPNSVHKGLLGLALSPKFLNGDDTLYIYYTYQDGDNLYGRLAKYPYNAKAGTIGNGTTVIEKLPAGQDHNAGRVVFGPDGKLYLSKGDLGHNQGSSVALEIEAQRLPTADEVQNKNWVSYVGKVLRLNTDGSIPDDNPVLAGVKSHVFTYGHRNPQGLVFAGDVLFSSEHGPSSDDEVNRLEAGGKYGWPHVAGYQDDQAYVYANYSKASPELQKKYDANVIPDGVPVQKESDWKRPDNFKDPIKTFNTVPRDYNYSDVRAEKLKDTFGFVPSYILWPTIGPSSITYYPADGAVPSLRHSLIVGALKNGCLYVVPLAGDGKHAQGDVQTLFRSQNRYRAVAISPDGKQIFVATDKGGFGRGLDGLPAKEPKNPGAILVFTYQE
ncbi:MAG: PQQ-dependent sugar dehydrogenase [Planctomycetaceae bacterium]|nr:PQQ-dependent sugar dehydrogenase [Planctomycetaceae bacterium]